MLNEYYNILKETVNDTTGNTLWFFSTYNAKLAQQKLENLARQEKHALFSKIFTFEVF